MDNNFKKKKFFNLISSAHNKKPQKCVWANLWKLPATIKHKGVRNTLCNGKNFFVRIVLP
jgi:hypothetical protein